MFTFSLPEAFLTIFIGMGPIKVLLVYIAKIQGMDRDVKRKIAQRAVIVAGSVGVALFILGAILQAALHFSIGALNIIGGIILLLLALNMVMGGGPSSAGEEETDPMSLAISPLAIQLMLNGLADLGIISLSGHA